MRRDLEAQLDLREKEVVQKVVAILKEDLNPSRIILFGSRAERHHRQGSDFDFAVDQSPPDILKREHIRQRIEKAAGLHGVDVVYLKNVERVFREIVLETGVVVYEKKD